MRRLLMLATIICLHVLPAIAEEGFVPLFDGKSLDGFKKVGGGATYRVEDECIVGEVGPGPNTFLRTLKTYRNFELKLDFILDVPGNSGIQIRSNQREADDGNGRVFGYQCEIDPSSRAWTAGIYDEARRGWLYPLKDQPKSQAAYQAGKWNHVEIHCDGPFIKTWLNDVPCANLVDALTDEGFIALQVHAGKAGRIRWKNIQIKELPDSKWTTLLNGKTTSGWKVIGDGAWKFEERILHASKEKAGGHGYLLNDQQFGNFVLKVVFQAVEGDSGLYFRCQPVDSELLVDGMQVQIHPAKDVGGFYEFGGRGWVSRPDEKLVERAFKPGEWNELKLLSHDGKLVTYLNGMQIAKLDDDPSRRQGHIALQLHGNQKMDVRFKSVDILQLEQSEP